MSCQSRFDARYWMLVAGALGRPRGMVWGGSKEIPGLISFRMDWLDLLAVQGSLKSLLQHHSSKASILRPSNTKLYPHPELSPGPRTASQPPAPGHWRLAESDYKES